MNIFKAIGDRVSRRQSIHALGTSGSTYDYTLVSDEQIAKFQATATVYTCADLIAKSVAQIDFKCADPFWNNTFNHPNEYQSRYDYFYTLAWDALCFGNAYSYKSEKNRAPRGVLAPLESQNIEPIGKMSPKFRALDTEKEYSGKRIWHIRHGGGSDVKAIGRVHAAYSRVKALESCDREINDVFANGLSAQHVLSGGHANEGELKKMMIAIKQAFGVGGKQRGGVVALTGGFKIDSIKGVTPADSNLRELRMDLIREIAAIFGVPPFAVGGASDTKFTNTVARHQQTNSYALMPLAENIASKGSHSFGSEVSFSEESIINSDFAMKLDFAIQAAGGSVLTPDEARTAWLNRGPAPNGDGERLRAGWTEDRNSASGDEGRDPLPEDDGQDSDT